jgi:hypothetical protein
MAGPIRADDTAQDRITKLLPADVTAAFLSAKTALVALFAEYSATYVFWTFVAILVICPFYFWFVTKATNFLQIGFLMLSFVVFAVSIADTQFIAYLQKLFPRSDNLGPIIQTAASVLPILWAFLISQIFVAAFGDKMAVRDAPGPGAGHP